MKTVILSDEEYRVLKRVVNRMCSKYSWLNSCWREAGSEHERAMLHRVNSRLHFISPKAGGPPEARAGTQGVLA